MTNSSPPAPDYAGAAQAQGAASMDVTNTQNFANRPDINTPFGSQWWTTAQDVDPATGQLVTRWQQNNALTDPYQKALDSQMSITQGRSDAAQSMLGDVTKNATNPMDWNSFQALGTGPQSYNPLQGPSQSGNVAAPQMTGRVSGPQSQQLQRSLDSSGLQNVDSGQQYVDKAGDAVYNQFSRRQEPLFQDQNASLKQQLYNSGLKEGDEAYDKAMRNQQNQQSDARLNAMDQATQASGAQASRIQGMDLSTNQNQFGQRQASGQFANDASGQQYGQDLQGANFQSGQNDQQFSQGTSNAGFNLGQNAQQYQQGLQGSNFQAGQMQQQFGNQATQSNYQDLVRQQQIAEALQQRNLPLNQMNALLSGQQVGQQAMPDFNKAGLSQTPDLMSAAQGQYGAAVGDANASNANNQQWMSALATGAMMLSDRRLKKNVVKIGRINGNMVYAYDYIWGEPGVGVMADEVRHIPGAVVRNAAGYEMVNYERL